MSDEPERWGVTITVYVDEQADVAKVAEQFSTIATGYGLDGHYATMSIYDATYDENDVIVDTEEDRS